jgi:hypothetical protein
MGIERLTRWHRDDRSTAFGWNPTLLRDAIRLATFWAVAIWQGGFVFYSGFVVKIGSWELKSDLQQGFITRRVTLELETLGWIALGVWAMSLWTTHFSRRPLRVAAAVLWCVVVAFHLGLHFQWHAVDRTLDVATRGIRDPAAFATAHRIFLWAASLQWLLVVILSGVTLQAWQLEKREGGASSPSSAPGGRRVPESSD